MTLVIELDLKVSIKPIPNPLPLLATLVRVFTDPIRLDSTALDTTRLSISSGPNRQRYPVITNQGITSGRGDKKMLREMRL